MKKFTIDEVNALINSMPYYRSVFDDNAADTYIHKVHDLRAKVDHLEDISGISELKRSKRKVTTMLRFYDVSAKPTDREFDDEFMANIKEMNRYLRSKEEFIDEEINRIASMLYIELEEKEYE